MNEKLSGQANGRTNADLRKAHAIRTEDMRRQAKGADEAMKIRITQGDGWYSDKVGEVYKVVGETKYLPDFIVKGTEGEEVVGAVSKQHCVVISDNTPPQTDVQQTQADNVNSPHHYTQGGVEVIDIIRQVTEGASGFEGYTLGNVIKYVMRYRHKNGAEDLRKAGVYLSWLTAEVEAKENTKEDE